MKNIDTPTTENFVFTLKKKRMIQAYMNDFIKSKEYEVFIDPFYSPPCNELKNFLVNGCKFLKNIKFMIGIETINNYWTGHLFQYGIHLIEAKTKAREIFTAPENCGNLKFIFRPTAEPEKLTSREIFKLIIMNPTEGRIVTFKPSANTKDRFRKKQKDTYPAIVTDVNENSVDLTVFGVGETIHVNNVKNAAEADENHSSWDWPKKVEAIAPAEQTKKEPEAQKEAAPLQEAK